MVQADIPSNHRLTDRVLVLKPIDGRPLRSSGVIDKTLFTTDNALHVVQDTSSTLWSLSYSQGKVPPAFKQQFTTFQSAYKFLQVYYQNRNIEIVEVID